jgi:DNA-binding NarL/FixJ family response regulator
MDILKLLTKGYSNKEIASELLISEKTVKNHITSIFRKIKVDDRTQAVLYAVKHRLVEL